MDTFLSLGAMPGGVAVMGICSTRFRSDEIADHRWLYSFPDSDLYSMESLRGKMMRLDSSTMLSRYFRLRAHKRFSGQQVGFRTSFGLPEV